MIPFEDFLFYDALKNHCPADAFTILRFSGTLDRERLENAIQTAVKRSQIANRSIHLNEIGTISWSKTESPVQIRFFSGNPTSESLPNSFINPTREPGVRFWIYEAPEENSAQIWFQFHHVTTDALGSFLFLNEIFEEYAGTSSVREAIPPERELAKAAKPKLNRRLFQTAVWQCLSYAFSVMLSWRKKTLEFHETFHSAPDSILPQSNSRSNAQSNAPSDAHFESPFAQHFPMLFQTFTREETQMLLDAAHREKVSLNDILLTAASLAARKFQQIRFPDQEDRLLQIAIPVNLRQGKLSKVPLRNCVSVIFLTQKLTKIRDSLEQLRQIHREMKQKSERRFADLLLLELKWLCSVRFLRNRRWGMERFVQRKTPLASLVLSNLGILLNFSNLPRTEKGLLKVGSLTLEEIKQASPRTTNAVLTIAAGTYAGRLHLGMNHDVKRLSEDSANLFFQFFLEELQKFLA